MLEAAREEGSKLLDEVIDQLASRIIEELSKAVERGNKKGKGK